MALVAQHEFPEGERFCKHCGALGDNRLTATCLQRAIPVSELCPEPARRQLACEDTDTISVRLVELAKERLPVDVEPGPHDPGDCC